MNNDCIGPIVIGGIGGSGTRVIAHILRILNIFIGRDLNDPLDNLAYTLLFKRKQWFYQNKENQKEIFRGLRILEKSMKNPNPRFSIDESIFLYKAAISMFKNGHNVDGDGKGMWAFDRLKEIKNGKKDVIQNNVGWGWKEPNTHLILPYLNDFFPDLKYIHTVRNGLDMAFSSNQQQLFNWGPMYGVELPKNKEDIPEASFRYWVEANKRVIEIGNTMGHNRFYLLNFDSLCLKTEAEIIRLLDFLEIGTLENALCRVTSLNKITGSIGRYKNEDVSWVKNDDLVFLKTLGIIL